MFVKKKTLEHPKSFLFVQFSFQFVCLANSIFHKSFLRGGVLTLQAQCYIMVVDLFTIRAIYFVYSSRNLFCTQLIQSTRRYQNYAKKQNQV